MAGDWIVRAACRGKDPELFFPISTAAEAAVKAVAICEGCPVIQECLMAAVARRERGVWGGTTEAERANRFPVAHISPDPDAPVDSKPCNTCGQTKPLTDFYPDRRASDGRQGRCKACHLQKVAGCHMPTAPSPTRDEAARRRAELLDAL